MALPPEPIAELLPKAAWVVEAEVSEIVAQGAPAPKVKAPPGATSTGQKVRAQTVKLLIKRVLQGKGEVKELIVEKPLSGYALKPGNKGPFLLDGSKPRPVILGRFGPDTWSLAKVEEALKGR